MSWRNYTKRNVIFSQLENNWNFSSTIVYRSYKKNSLQQSCSLDDKLSKERKIWKILKINITPQKLRRDGIMFCDDLFSAIKEVLSATQHWYGSRVKFSFVG
jgi:hypothetical protein